VVCLDCGYRAKTLRRHISTQHGLSPDEYLKRWGLRSNHPLIVPGYSEHRSTVAKESGFGRKPEAQVTRCLAKQQRRSIMIPRRRLPGGEGLDLEQSRRMF
jgi:predicted transcriptional regulator